jgi:hypothetical protein
MWTPSTTRSSSRTCTGHGGRYRVSSLTELGDTPEYRYALYELNKALSVDIPDRGQFYAYEEYLAERIDVPAFMPAG